MEATDRQVQVRSVFCLTPVGWKGQLPLAAPAAYPTSILILIEEKPQWILVVEADIEMIDEK